MLTWVSIISSRWKDIPRWSQVTSCKFGSSCESPESKSKLSPEALVENFIGLLAAGFVLYKSKPLLKRGKFDSLFLIVYWNIYSFTSRQSLMRYRCHWGTKWQGFHSHDGWWSVRHLCVHNSEASMLHKKLFFPVLMCSSSLNCLMYGILCSVSFWTKRRNQ